MADATKCSRLTFAAGGWFVYFEAITSELNTGNSKDRIRCPPTARNAPCRSLRKVRAQTADYRLQVAGEPVPVAKAVPFFEPTAWSEFEASGDGCWSSKLNRERNRVVTDLERNCGA